MSDEKREYRVHWQSKWTKSRGVGLYLTKRKAIAWAKREDEQWPEIEHWVMHHPPEGEPYKVYPHSTDIAAAMKVFDWLAQRGVVRLSNGDGDSYDCDFIPTSFAPDGLQSASGFVDMFDWQGTREGAWAYVICLTAHDAIP